MRRSLSPRIVCCALFGGGSPASRHHACAKRIIHQHSGLTASGPTCPLFAAPLLGSLAVPLPYMLRAPSVGEDGLWQVFSGALFCFSFFVVSFALPAVVHSQCFWTALLGIVLLTWGPWLPLFSAVCIWGVLTILLVLCCGCLPRQHGSDKP